MRKRVAGIGTIGGPLAFLLGWAVLMLRAGGGPDFGWFLSHGLLLGAVALFVVSVGGWRELLGARTADSGNWADVGVGLVLLGALGLAGQFAIDLAVGHLASGQPEMSALLRRISAAPGILLPFHIAGPFAFYIGLLIMVSLLFRARIIPLWAAAPAGAGIIAVGAGGIAGIATVVLLGFACLFAGCLPIGRAILRQSA